MSSSSEAVLSTLIVGAGVCEIDLSGAAWSHAVAVDGSHRRRKEEGTPGHFDSLYLHGRGDRAANFIVLCTPIRLSSAS